MLTTDVINLKNVNHGARELIARHCFDEVFQRIWDGVTYDEFFQMFFATANVEKIFLFKTFDQKLAGYFIYRVIELEIEKKRYGVARLSTNILPQHFGHNLLHRIVFFESFKYFIKSLFNRRSFVLFFTANSPTSYCLFKRRSRKIFPCPKYGVPAPYRKLMLAACQKFQITLTDAENFVVSYPVILRPDVVQRMKKTITEDEIYHFYMAKCPRYDQGQALVTMKPVNLIDACIDTSQQLYRLTLYRFTRQLKSIGNWSFGNRTKN